MGNRYLRRRLHPGAIAQAGARRLGKAGDDRLWQILSRKKPRQAAIAPANRMARTAHALMRNKTEFQAAQTA
jgi:transposase